MYRLLGLAKYEERFVIPTTHKETYLDTYHAQGSQGYGGENFGVNCEGCGVAVATDKSGQDIYNERFYGGFSVINFDNLYRYQDSLGYIAMQLCFPEKRHLMKIYLTKSSILVIRGMKT